VHSRQLTTGEQGTAAELQLALQADHCPDPSAAQRIVLALVASAAARHRNVSSYLHGLPGPWVDKRSRKAWRLVHDVSTLEAHVAKLVELLASPALARAAAPPEDLDSYVARFDAADADSSGTPAGQVGGEWQG